MSKYLSRFLAGLIISLIALVTLAQPIGRAHAASLTSYPAAIDSDVVVRCDSIALSAHYFAAEGYMHLAQVPNTTHYSGFFADNLGGGKVYPASADVTNPAEPSLSLNTHTGTFVFTLTTNFGAASYYNTSTTRQPTITQGTKVLFYTNSHQYKTHTYTLSFGANIGLVGQKAQSITAIMTLISDNNDNGFIVPKDPLTHAISSLSVPTKSGKSLVTPITAPGAYALYIGQGADYEYLVTAVKLNGVAYGLEGHTTDNGATYDGSMLAAGSGSHAVFGYFYASQTS